jgi:hypothetical protein
MMAQFIPIGLISHTHIVFDMGHVSEARNPHPPVFSNCAPMLCASLVMLDCRPFLATRTKTQQLWL